ncbi:MAG: hypothetical protein JXQ72_03355 [Anaerolineae bacterium]|nr:hypothetical protein [Anaerolineae bacterium]
MKLSSRAHDLFAAFQQSGCPVCRLTNDSIHHYLFSLTYEFVNKPPTHEAIRAARGLCNSHGWHVIEQFNNTALGIAVLYEGLIRNMLKDMGSVKPGDGRRQLSKAAGALAARAECPACTHQATTEDHILRNLLDHMDQDEFAAGFRVSAGLCLPHLRQALERPGQQAAKAVLVAAQQDIWDRLRADLAEYIRKNDHRFNTTEEMGPEGDSPRRAIDGMSGMKGIR